MIYGGGWPEIKMAKAVEELAARTPGMCACVYMCACLNVCACVCVLACARE